MQEHISRKSFFKRVLVAGAAVFSGGAMAAGETGGAKFEPKPAAAARPEPRSIPRDAANF